MKITNDGVEEMFKNNSGWEEKLKKESPTFFSVMCNVVFEAAKLESTQDKYESELRTEKLILGYVFGSIYHSNDKQIPVLTSEDYSKELSRNLNSEEVITQTMESLILVNSPIGEIVRENLYTLKHFSSFVVCVLISTVLKKL